MAVSNYGVQAELAQDKGFTQRVTSCVWSETSVWASPPTKAQAIIAGEIMPIVAASPGFTDAYIWGDKASGAAPGHANITDGQILAAVQPLLEDYRPTA